MYMHMHIHIHILVFRLFSHLGHYRLLSRVPSAIQEVLISYLIYIWASLVAQWLRIGLPMQTTRVLSLSWEDPLDKEMATHCSILA